MIDNLSNKKIYFLDDNIVYADSFIQSFLLLSKGNKLTAFSSIDELFKNKESIKNNILIISEKIYEQNKNEFNYFPITNLIILTNENKNKFNYFYKFDDIKKIINFIEFIKNFPLYNGNLHPFDCKEIFSKLNNGIKVYNFISDKGGAGLTTFALAFANYISRYKNENTLFLPLTEIFPVKFFEKHEINRTFIFDYFFDEEKTFKNINNYLTKNLYDLYYFNSDVLENPFLELEKTDLIKILYNLLEIKKINSIVFDYGTNIKSFKKRIRFKNEKNISLITDDEKLSLHNEKIFNFQRGIDINEDEIIANDIRLDGILGKNIMNIWEKVCG
ncbi:MAG: hypothetical protein LBD41_03405 [Clostridiales Family XIII bacterium]|jgi:hypothetical protein|nr:hypothetical protein [Clostridiales Family XIII bacterium]